MLSNPVVPGQSRCGIRRGLPNPSPFRPVDCQTDCQADTNSPSDQLLDALVRHAEQCCRVPPAEPKLGELLSRADHLVSSPGGSSVRLPARSVSAPRHRCDLGRHPILDDQVLLAATDPPTKLVTDAGLGQRDRSRVRPTVRHGVDPHVPPAVAGVLLVDSDISLSHARVGPSEPRCLPAGTDNAIVCRMWS